MSVSVSRRHKHPNTSLHVIVLSISILHPTSFAQHYVRQGRQCLSTKLVMDRTKKDYFYKVLYYK